MITLTVDASDDSCFNDDRSNTHWFLLESRDCRWLVPRSGHCQETVLKKSLLTFFANRSIQLILKRNLLNIWQNVFIHVPQGTLVHLMFAALTNIKIGPALQFQITILKYPKLTTKFACMLFFLQLLLLFFAITQLMAGDYSWAGCITTPKNTPHAMPVRR